MACSVARGMANTTCSSTVASGLMGEEEADCDVDGEGVPPGADAVVDGEGELVIEGRLLIELLG